MDEFIPGQAQFLLKFRYKDPASPFLLQFDMLDVQLSLLLAQQAAYFLHQPFFDIHLK